MPSGAITKMMANKQLRVLNDNNNVQRWMAYTAKMTNIDYSRCNSFVLKKQPVKEVHDKFNLLHTEEIQYRFNLSKRDRIMGGKNLALVDSGANGMIIGLDMLILYFNNNGYCVSIGIIGDHQLTDNRLCCGYSVAKPSVG